MEKAVVPVKSVTRQDLPKLKKLYGKAIKENKDSFMFYGAEILTVYAKYLIQYLES